VFNDRQKINDHKYPVEYLNCHKLRNIFDYASLIKSTNYNFVSWNIFPFRVENYFVIEVQTFGSAITLAWTAYR